MTRTLLATLGLVLAGCGAPTATAPALDDLGPVGDFTLTERSGRAVRPADLAGKVWVASFVFTRCTGPCPQVTGTVAKLQKAFADEPDVRLVTFTVDPEHDRPDELKKYAGHFGADPERWLFLTGPEAAVHRLIRASFKLHTERAEERQPGKEVDHSTKLVVVDRQSRIRAYFDGRQVDDEGRPVDDTPRVRAAVAALLREAP